MQSFLQQVYAAVKEIPKGTVSTYGRIAAMIGTRDARRVGHALHANSDPSCPCHRVVFSDGRLAPGYAFGGAKAQRKKLEEEGIMFTQDGRVSVG